MTLGSILAVAEALELRVDVVARWRGSELDRLVDASHSAMYEELARRLGRLPAWVFEPEVSFAVFGERGVIDILAWHAGTRSLLIIELKTLLVDIGDLLRTMGSRRRLASEIVAERGWQPLSVSLWVVLGATMTNRRRVADHFAILRRAFPDDGRAMNRWLRAPAGSIAALSFVSYERQENGIGGRTRVRRRRAAHTHA